MDVEKRLTLYPVVSTIILECSYASTMGLFDLFKIKDGTSPANQPILPKILVVDDDQLLRTYYHDLLVKNNYQVTTVTNGQEAINTIPQLQPDLIILDIVMPIMDGKQTLKHLRDHEETKKIPVIMLTSAASVQNMDETKLYAANNFLNKNTVTPEEIISTIEMVLTTNASQSI